MSCIRLEPRAQRCRVRCQNSVNDVQGPRNDQAKTVAESKEVQNLVRDILPLHKKVWDSLNIQGKQLC